MDPRREPDLDEGAPRWGLGPLFEAVVRYRPSVDGSAERDADPVRVRRPGAIPLVLSIYEPAGCSPHPTSPETCTVETAQ